MVELQGKATSWQIDLHGELPDIKHIAEFNHSIVFKTTNAGQQIR